MTLVSDDRIAGNGRGVVFRKDHPTLDVVFLTATEAPEKLERIRAVSPRKVLRKPIDSRELYRALIMA